METKTSTTEQFQLALEDPHSFVAEYHDKPTPAIFQAALNRVELEGYKVDKNALSPAHMTNLKELKLPIIPISKTLGNGHQDVKLVVYASRERDLWQIVNYATPAVTDPNWIRHKGRTAIQLALDIFEKGGITEDE